MPITQVISSIPTPGHRGVDSQNTFVTKQEAFQDALVTTTVIELNNFKTQANALETNVNNLEATVVAKEALVNPHYSAIDAVAADIVNIDSVVSNAININAVATDLTNINSVATDLTNIDAVATDLTNINAVAADLTNINNASANAATATAKALEATNSAAIASAYANFKGDWSTLSGALNIPASVYHNGNFWVLLHNITNVALSEPTLLNSDWYISATATISDTSVSTTTVWSSSRVLDMVNVGELLVGTETSFSITVPSSFQEYETTTSFGKIIINGIVEDSTYRYILMTTSKNLTGVYFEIVKVEKLTNRIVKSALYFEKNATTVSAGRWWFSNLTIYSGRLLFMYTSIAGVLVSASVDINTLSYDGATQYRDTSAATTLLSPQFNTTFVKFSETSTDIFYCVETATSSSSANAYVTLIKQNKSTLAFQTLKIGVANTDARYSSAIIDSSETYIYVHVGDAISTVFTIYKVLISDFNTNTPYTYTAAGGNGGILGIDATYLYILNGTKLHRIALSTMAVSNTSNESITGFTSAETVLRNNVLLSRGKLYKFDPIGLTLKYYTTPNTGGITVLGENYIILQTDYSNTSNIDCATALCVKYSELSNNVTLNSSIIVGSTRPNLGITYQNSTTITWTTASISQTGVNSYTASVRSGSANSTKYLEIAVFPSDRSIIVIDRI